MRCGTVRGLCLMGMAALAGTAIGMQGGFQPNLAEGNSLIGQEVRGSDGETIGTLEELIVDAGQNKIGFAIVSTGGETMGDGESYLVPWEQFKVQSTGGESPRITLNLDESRLQQMPAVDADAEMSRLRNAIRESPRRPQRGRQQPPDRTPQRQPQRRRPQRQDTPRQDQRRQSDTDVFIIDEDVKTYRMGGGQQGQQQPYHKLTSLIGMDVADQQDEVFGSLEDVIIDSREGGLAYGIVSYGGFLGIAEDLAAVPWTTLQIEEQQDRITLNARQDVLDQVAYQQGNVRRLEDPQYSRQIYEMFNEEPYWVIYGYAPADERDAQDRMSPQGGRQQQQQVRGEIARLQTQQVDNQRMTVAEVETQDGRTQLVILGSPDQLRQLDLEEGDRIQVEGLRTRFQGQSALQATQIRSDGQQVRIRQPQGRTPQRQPQRDRMPQGRRSRVQAWSESGQYSQAFDPENTQSYSGTVESVGSFRPQPGAIEGLRLKIRTDDGQIQTVYAGPKAYIRQQGLKFRQGDTVEITASETEFNDRQVLIASEIQKNGRSVQLFDDQGTPAWSTQELMQFQGDGDGEQQSNGERPPQSNGEPKGVSEQPKGSGEQQVKGEISSLQTKTVRGQEQMVAEIETQDGQTQQVILGSPDQLQKLDLKEGSRVTVKGSQTQFEGQSAVQATEISSNGEQVKIRQKQK